MYEAHFGLRENPFSSSPSPEFIYQSGEHREALAHFQYAITNREPFVLLTGEVGTGKTTAIQALRRLLPTGAPVALVAHTTLEPRELIEEIAMRFGLDPQPGESKPALMHRLEAFLEERGRAGTQALLVFDEAHLMSVGLLEEVRLLSNLESPRGGKLLQICLVGQPELERHLQSPELRQLRQRISVRYSLHPLNREDTGAYIHHRLRAAGCPQPAIVFPDEAVGAVHGLSQGIPREINVLAGQALLNAFLEDASSVGRAHVYSAKSDYGFQGIVTGAAALSPETPAPPVPRRVPGEEAVAPPSGPLPPRRPIPLPPPALRPPAREPRPTAPVRAEPSVPRSARVSAPAPGRSRISFSAERSRGGHRGAWILSAAFVAIVITGLAFVLRSRSPVTDDMTLNATAPLSATGGMVRNEPTPFEDSLRTVSSVTQEFPREEPVNPPADQAAGPVSTPAANSSAVPVSESAPSPAVAAADSATVDIRPAEGMSERVSIQVASFKTRRRAEEVLAAVTERTGLPGAVLATEVNGVVWQRILLGSFLNEAEAREAAQPLLRDRTISTVVVRPIPIGWASRLSGATGP
jgi:type II secretory pathway predicted ATPase ExeA